MAWDSQAALYVFPLPRMVLFPGTTKPLNIFEPRYVKMVIQAIEDDSLVALAYSDPRRFSEGGVRRVAGVGRPVLLDERSDGSLLILIEAIGKVRLRPRPYQESIQAMYGMEWIQETNVLERENIFILNRIEKSFVRWLYENVGDRVQLQIFLTQLRSAHEKINYFSSLMIHDAEVQQRLLEMNDINERLFEISQLLDHEEQLFAF